MDLPEELMALTPDQQKAELLQTLAELRSQKGAAFCESLTALALANLAEGRLAFFYAQHPDRAAADYIARLVEFYERLQPYIQAVQEERAHAVWEPLYPQMQKLAYGFLLKRGLTPGAGTAQLAIDCAADAAMSMLKARFPYDTDFEPWLYQFIKFACLKKINREMRQAEKIKQALLLSLTDDELAQRSDGRADWELQADLIDALRRLTPKRLQVIKLRYARGLSSREIAAEMGSSVSAVDKLHHDAIQQLRALLDE